MFKKILVPSDLREASLVAIRAGVALARNFGAELYLLNIRPEFMSKEEMEMLRVSARKFIEEEQEIAVNAKMVLSEMLRREGGTDIAHKIVLREGSPNEEILTTATELGCDLIIITTTGRTHLAEHLHGSDSERIVRDALIPILVIPIRDKS
jgi:nucleotide-binding universal stress UspA family protein